MFYWALVFLIVAIIAGILGFSGIAATSEGFARVLFFVSLVLFLLALLINAVKNRRP